MTAQPVMALSSTPSQKGEPHIGRNPACADQIPGGLGRRGGDGGGGDQEGEAGGRRTVQVPEQPGHRW